MIWVILLDERKTDREYVSYIRNKLNWQIDINNLHNEVKVELLDQKYYFMARYISVVDKYIEIRDNFIATMFKYIVSSSHDCIELRGVMEINGQSVIFNNTHNWNGQVIIPVSRLNPIINRVVLSNFDYYLANDNLSSIVQTICKIEDSPIVSINKQMVLTREKLRGTKSMHRVLVIIPAYNAEQTIAESIQSVLNQTHSDIIVVVVNDCSRDGTLSIIRNFDVEVINLSKNVGTYNAVNHALYRIRNYDYFIIHGADDIMHPDNIEKHLNVFREHKNCLASVSGYARYYYDTKVAEKQSMFGDSMYMYSRKVFDRLGYYDSTRFGGDTEYASRFFKCFGRNRIKSVGKVLTDAYIMSNNSNLTTVVGVNSKQRLEYSKKFEEEHARMVITKDFYRKAFDDKFISFNVASIPTRVDILRRTVESVVDQCDIVNVFLNGYEAIPDYLIGNNIVVWQSQDYTDRGDAGKFFKVAETNGYYLTGDDDLAYPPDYVSKLIYKVEEYNRKFIITCHGRTLVDGQVSSYYSPTSRLYQCHCLKDQDIDRPVQVGGTGVMCLHSSTIKVSFNDFLEPNMADIWMFKLSQEQKVGIVSIAHTKSWLQYLKGENDSDTIYSQHHNRDSIQTSVINSFEKRYLPTLPKYRNLEPYLLTSGIINIPLVTVIIPYNKDRGFLSEAIASVESQTYNNIEIILSYSSNNVGHNINSAIIKSNGTYIKYLSEDDILPSNSIQDSIEAIISGDYDFIHGNSENFFEDGRIEMHKPDIKIPNKEELIYKNIIHGGTLMYHKRVFDKFGLFDEKLWTAEEFEFNLRILNNGAKLGYCDKTLYRYRRHELQKSIGTGIFDSKYQIKRMEVKENIIKKYL